MTLGPKLQKQQRKFSKVTLLLKERPDDIQKLAGEDSLPADNLNKYTKAHVKILKALADNLDNFEKGTAVFKKLGEEIAKDAVLDGLTIEEAVDETVLQKRAIWKKVEDVGIIQNISAQELYELSQVIDSYCDVLTAKTASTYHHYLTEKILGTEERFRALIEKSSDAIALVSPKGKVIYASPATKRLMGYTPEEFQGLKNPFELAPPDDRKVVTKLFEKLLQQPDSTERAVYRVLHKNGEHIWIESAMTNLLNDPNVKAVVINYRDISERKLLETQKIDFISIATHELKTPVTSIKGFTQVLQSRFAKEGHVNAVEMLLKMDVQLKKLNSLINDLLNVTEIDGGKLQFHQGHFDFNELARDIANEMQLTTIKHHITKKIAPSMIIDGDRDRIGQVVTNLLSNAIKYSPHNEQIIITTSGNKKQVKLSVRDFGIGIPKEKQGKVFDRFFRAGDADDTFAGLGLGLFISNEIVKRHGGRMWVETTAGRGSTLCFTLPIKHTKTINQSTNALVEEDLLIDKQE